MNLTESLEALAEQNHYGIAFLLSYGASWIACGVLWRILTPGNAALATLFQGIVASPIGFGLAYAIGALGRDRPVDDAITVLSLYIGGSQFLGLPFLIYLQKREMFTLVPYGFVAICAMHFVLYSWLYQTPLYVVMSMSIAVGGTIIMFYNDGHPDETRAASQVCFFTGGAMLLTSVAFTVV